MFYHDNGKLQVFANTRCANTNMHYYFNVHLDKQKDFPTKFSNDLVIVLRNPLDRVVSATEGIPTVMHLVIPLKHNLEHVLGENPSIEMVEEYMIFQSHCSPYLASIRDKDFRIIDFEKINEYIPRKENVFFQSPVTNTKGHTDPKQVYVENKYFSLSDLETEYEIYLSLLKDREQISVTEWKEKTT